MAETKVQGVLHHKAVSDLTYEELLNSMAEIDLKQQCI
jgi:hypothetical protein